MKQFGIATLLALGLVLGGCGGGNTSGNINGNWTATLSNPDGSPALAFTTTLTQSSGTSVSVANFTFTTPSSPCFSTATTQTASFALSGNSSGSVTGTFGLTIQTMFPAATNNVLTLQGNVNNNTITGTWTLTGTSGCTGSGSFTMTKM